MNDWSFDMTTAPRWRRLQVACRVQTNWHPEHIHRWTCFMESYEPSIITGLEYAWREPRNAAEPLAPLP